MNVRPFQTSSLPFVSPVTKTCTVPVEIGAMVYNRAKARRADPPNVSPARKGWVSEGKPEHRRCGTLPQPHFAIPGRGTSSSNKINATKSLCEQVRGFRAALEGGADAQPERLSWLAEMQQRVISRNRFSVREVARPAGREHAARDQAFSLLIL
jgi:hypothetical protein